VKRDSLTAKWIGLRIFGAIPFLALSAGAQCLVTRDVTSSIQYVIAPSNDSLLVCDTARGRILALDECLGVVCLYDGVSWVRPVPPPYQDLPPCSNRGAWVYDKARGVALLLTGYVGTQPSTGFYSYDTQAWKGLTWTGASPPAIYAALGAFDPGRNRAIFLTQSDLNAPNTWSTWEWTGSGWDQGPILANADPDSFTFDSVRGLGFLSGRDPASSNEAVWLYTPRATAAASSWARVTITGDTYKAVTGATLAFDPVRDRVIRCMGKEFDPAAGYGYTPEIDTWDWTQSKWKNDLSANLPDADRRAGAGAAYDLNRDLLVIYGGFSYQQDPNGIATPISWRDTWEQQVLDVLYVDGGNVGTQDGSVSHPYRTVHQAAAGITTCIRAMSIQSGTYAEGPLTINTPIRLEARHGPVEIH
jgi:hypothetical protein